MEIPKEYFESHWINKSKATSVLKLAELHKADLKSVKSTSQKPSKYRISSLERQFNNQQCGTIFLDSGSSNCPARRQRA